jgi:hypothetical protein
VPRRARGREGLDLSRTLLSRVLLSFPFPIPTVKEAGAATATAVGAGMLSRGDLFSELVVQHIRTGAAPAWCAEGTQYSLW